MNCLMLPLALVLAAAAVQATPVERTSGVISIKDDELALESNHQVTAVNRGCPDCNNGLLLPYLYHHLVDADERRGLDKRSPKKFKKFGKKSFKSIKKGGKKTGKFGKNFGKAFKPGSPQNKVAKKGIKFGGKNFAKAFKPGSPQNKKLKKAGKKAKKGGKKGGKGLVKSSPLSIPALGGGGGGALAFGVLGTGFAGFAVPGLAQAGFDYVTG